MSLNVQALFERTKRSYKSQNTSGTFELDFVDAVNSVLDDLKIAGDLATPIDHIASVEASISELSEHHMNIVKKGLDVYLKDFGNMGPKVGPKMYQIALDEWDKAMGDFMIDASATDQADVDSDDNPESDIIGLGVKTP